MPLLSQCVSASHQCSCQDKGTVKRGKGWCCGRCGRSLPMTGARHRPTGKSREGMAGCVTYQRLAAVVVSQHKGLGAILVSCPPGPGRPYAGGPEPHGLHPILLGAVLSLPCALCGCGWVLADVCVCVCQEPFLLSRSSCHSSLPVSPSVQPPSAANDPPPPTGTWYSA
jgi:hypothetical protein